MERPIFIVGTTRSGSTLLRLVLDSHERLALGPETYVMGAASAFLDIPGWKYGDEWYARIGWSAQELHARLGAFLGGMFERYAEAQGKQRWGEKTPRHVWHMHEISSLFPDAVFLGIVRHPGAVVSSLRRRFHYGFDDAAHYWSQANAEMLRRGADVGERRFRLVRYEDLLRCPEPTLRETLGFLGEPWSAAVLRHHEVQREKGARRVDGHTDAREAIDPGRETAWVDELTDDEHRSLEEVTSPLAGALGYRRRRTEDRPPAAAADTLLLHADDLVGTLPPEHATSTATRRRLDLLARDKDELVDELISTQDTLARTRSRRVVRLAEAVRQGQRARSVGQLWGAVRDSRRTTPGKI